MILVTGGTGLVGSHLLFQLISKGEKVRAIHRASSNIKAVQSVFEYYSSNAIELFNQIEWMVADLNDIYELEKAFESISTVYHSAALISFNPKDDKSMIETNIDGTAYIVNLCVSNKIDKLCFVSSVAAIDKAPNTDVYDESGGWNIDQNNYGYAISKHGAEMEVWRASAEGVPVVIVNPGVIFGPGFWENGPGAIFSKVHGGLRFYSEGITGYVGVNDVVTVMIQLMKSSIENERFILVSENRSFKDVLFKIADSLGKKRPPIRATPRLTGFGWRFAKFMSLITGKPALLTKRSAKSLHSHVFYSSDKIKKALNFSFEPLEETIDSVCKYYKTNL